MGSIMLTASLLAFALAGDGVTTTFVPSGAVQKAGGYMPVRSVMSTTKPTSVSKAPEGLASARYGMFKFGTTEVGYILSGDKLYVDANHDGDYTNDPAAEWKERNGGMMMGSAKVDIGRGAPAGISFYHFPENDPNRVALKDTMLYYGDFGYEIQLTMGNTTSTSFVAGDLTPTSSLWVDRDGNKQQSYNYEFVTIGKPFNFTGTTYVIELDRGQLHLRKSDQKLPVAPMPPDLSVGKSVLKFKAKTMDGKQIDFPGTFKGKVVLMDFWATWCGPCMAEMPNVVKNYNEFHARGLEILGISFDQPNAEAKIKEVTTASKMPWAQIYEGKTWETTLGKQFDVSAIPFSLLVDGSTGKILATVNNLRGEELKKTLEKVFANRH